MTDNDMLIEAYAQKPQWWPSQLTHGTSDEYGNDVPGWFDCESADEVDERFAAAICGWAMMRWLDSLGYTIGYLEIKLLLKVCRLAEEASKPRVADRFTGTDSDLSAATNADTRKE